MIFGKDSRVAHTNERMNVSSPFARAQYSAARAEAVFPCRPRLSGCRLEAPATPSQVDAGDQHQRG